MGEHYFASRPAAASRPGEVHLVLPDVTLRLATDRGMFSPDRVDRGTRILLETVPPPPPAGTLVDLGCGYGPIALTAAARAPGATILGVDVNERAVGLARRNAQTARLYNVDFVLPDQLPGELVVDALWSNPPIRVGKPALHELLDTWLHRLAPGGEAYLVVHRHLGADSLQRWLSGRAPTDRITSRSGYRVLRVTAPRRPTAARPDANGPGTPDTAGSDAAQPDTARSEPRDDDPREWES